MNYLRVCDMAAGDTCEEANPDSDGIRSVLKDERDLFVADRFYEFAVPSEWHG